MGLNFDFILNLGGAPRIEGYGRTLSSPLHRRAPSPQSSASTFEANREEEMFGLPLLPNFRARQRTLVLAATPVRRRGRGADRALVAAANPPVVVAESTVESIQTLLSGALGGQVTVGGVAGFATGYAAKRIGQVLLVIVGLEIVAMQAMAQRGWISVDWKAIGKELSPNLEKDRVERALEAVQYKMPFAGAFSAGCVAGLKWS